MNSNKATSSDDQRNINLYSSLLQEHGDSFKSLNWGSKASQQLRFKILAEIGFNVGDTVLDVGCGLGDLWQWLDENQQTVSYTGVDITPEMVKRASKRFPDINFIESSISENHFQKYDEFDFVVASGIFAHRQNNPVEFFHQTILNMYKKSKKGVAFNCLSSWLEDQEEGEFYADPLETVEYCRSISKKIVLRHDYHHGDFTIYMYKTDSAVKGKI